MKTEPRLLFHFIIPHTPVAKGRARSTVRRGKGGKPILVNGQPIVATYTPEATRDFEALVKDFAAKAIGGAGADPLTVPVDLLVEFRFRIPPAWPKWKRDLAAAGLIHHTKKPDCSNLVKAIEDACNGVLFRDDGQVVGCVQDKVWTTGAECVVVHGYRRAGLSCQASRADAEELAGFDPSMRMEHLPIGRRLRTLRLVTP
jgi:Holliday junction resolvase RusA-like endonuclease